MVCVKVVVVPAPTKGGTTMLKKTVGEGAVFGKSEYWCQSYTVGGRVAGKVADTRSRDSWKETGSEVNSQGGILNEWAARGLACKWDAWHNRKTMSERGKTSRAQPRAAVKATSIS